MASDIPLTSSPENSAATAKVGKGLRIVEYTIYASIGVSVLAAVLLAMRSKWAFSAGLTANTMLSAALVAVMLIVRKFVQRPGAAGMALLITGLGAPLMYLGMWYLSVWTRLPAVLIPGIWYGSMRLAVGAL